MTSRSTIKSGMKRLNRAAKQVREAAESEARDGETGANANVFHRVNADVAVNVGSKGSVERVSSHQSAGNIRQVNGRRQRDSE